MNLPTQQLTQLEQRLTAALPAVSRREQRFKGNQPLRYAADDVKGDLKNFSVNLCRLAVTAVAERMRVKRVTAAARDTDLTQHAVTVWSANDLDQWLAPLLTDALALGSAYLIVWADEEAGAPVITAESAKQVAVERHPVTNKVTAAIKRWTAKDAAGAIASEHAVLYTANYVQTWARYSGGNWEQTANIPHTLGVVPVVPLINVQALGDVEGTSVIDDMGHLVDGLSKVLADVLVASEDTARPRRWATGVDLEEKDKGDGFTADGFTADGEQAEESAAPVSPFESGNRMFTVESPDAKFGQLEGANLQGYRTAVDLLVQQIMAVSSLPAHMMGITTANPSSADAIRSAEASLTTRAETAINTLGIGIERALEIAVAIATGYRVADIKVNLKWASAATRSMAQEADATAKLHALDIVTTEEARETMGYNNQPNA